MWVSNTRDGSKVFNGRALRDETILKFQRGVLEIKLFMDDTTLIGLISGGDESAYRWEIDHLVDSGDGSRVDFWKNPALPAPITLCDSPVDESFCFLGTTIHPGPQIGAEHHVNHQKGPAEDVFHAAAKEVQPAKDNDGALLHHHH